MLWQNFWNFYALVYDSISHLAPYRQLMGDLSSTMVGAAQGRLLDVGCGTGNLCRELGRRYPQAEIVGVDASLTMLKRARTKVPSTQLLQADLSRPLPFPDDSFDGIVCSNVLYTLDRPGEALKELRRVLKPGGRLGRANPTPGFSMQELVRCHLRQGWKAVVQFIPLIVPLLLVTAFNIAILGRVEKKTFHFTERQQLETWMREAHFDKMSFATTYGGQDILVNAIAPLEPCPQ